MEKSKDNIDDDESGKFFLLEELLKKNDQLQLVEGQLNRSRNDLDIIRKLVDCQNLAVALLDQHGNILYANRLWAELAGFGQEELKEKNIDTVLHPAAVDDNLSFILHNVQQNGHWQGKVTVKEKRQPKLLDFDCRRLADQKEKNAGFLCQLFSEDHKERVLDSSASTPGFTRDPLTGLPDRSSCQHYLSSSIEQAAKKGSCIGLLYIDIDKFNRVNRMLSPSFGDELLCRISSMLQESCKRAGGEYVARVGGDEFAIIISSLEKENQFEELADRILAKFQHPVTMHSRDIFLTLNIGISLYPDDAGDPSELLHNGETAMKMAKDLRSNKSYRWSSSIDSAAIHDMHLENDLRKAFENGELLNHYQPQISLTNGAIVGLEVLMRWKHPLHGNISPATFIPLAEKTQLIREISLNLLHEACKQGRKWLSMGLKDFVMAVNISGRMLHHSDLFEQITTCLDSTGFPVESLALELTETVLIENMDNTLALIDKCRNRGIKLAIDDFGTGYSSLSYLQRFNVHKVKIDRAFITGIVDNPSDAAITRAIIAMAKELGFQVVAEGVENEQQLIFLQKNNCDECQGFLISKALTAEQMTKLLRHDSSVAMKHSRIIKRFFSVKAKNKKTVK